MFRSAGLLSLVLAVLWAATAGAGDRSPATTLSRLAKERRDAARKTYRTTWANYRDGFAGEEQVYRWSKRWLEAERQADPRPDRQLAALRDHWERMRQMEKTVKSLQQARAITTDRVTAAEYYRAEAEMWLLEAKDRKDKH
jgi:hypothetical protein